MKNEKIILKVFLKTCSFLNFLHIRGQLLQEKKIYILTAAWLTQALHNMCFVERTLPLKGNTMNSL